MVSAVFRPRRVQVAFPARRAKRGAAPAAPRFSRGFLLPRVRGDAELQELWLVAAARGRSEGIPFSKMLMAWKRGNPEIHHSLLDRARRGAGAGWSARCQVRRYPSVFPRGDAPSSSPVSVDRRIHASAAVRCRPIICTRARSASRIVFSSVSTGVSFAAARSREGLLLIFVPWA